MVVLYLEDESLIESLQRRFDSLVRFYAPLGTGEGESRFRYEAAFKVAVGEIQFAGTQPDTPVVSWGERVPKWISSGSDLVDASDGELRRLGGSVAIFASDGQRARLVCGAGAPTSLYTAGADGCISWSTQAVAAAWMADGTAELDIDAIPELLALEFLAGDRTLVRGARSLPLATRVDFDGSPPKAASFWPKRERWAGIPPEDAYEHAESALLRTLSDRVWDPGPTYLGLTAGADSRVVAAAMAELGIEYSTFTWGDPAWTDVTGAQEIAQALGAQHELLVPEFLDPGEALTEAFASVRWTEGALPISFIRQPWPDPICTFVSGTGAETGRAFYYARRSSGEPDPDTAGVAETYGLMMENRLMGAKRGSRRAVSRRAQRLVFDAEDLGYRGWQCLDVVYGEQRVRRWARAYLPCLPIQLVPAFGAPEVMRGLANLPLRDRVSDGFHRRFMRARHENLVRPVPDWTKGSRPKAHHRLRSLVPPPARRAIDHLKAGRRTWPTGQWLYANRWDEYAELRDWIAEEALPSPEINYAMGARWSRTVRDGFLAGQRYPTVLALRASAPVALAHSMRGLET